MVPGVGITEVLIPAVKAGETVPKRKLIRPYCETVAKIHAQYKSISKTKHQTYIPHPTA